MKAQELTTIIMEKQELEKPKFSREDYWKCLEILTYLSGKKIEEKKSASNKDEKDEFTGEIRALQESFTLVYSDYKK